MTICQNNKKTLEHYLIEHCSPTLAGIKTANLFACSYETEADLEQMISDYNRAFSQKGLELMILRKGGGRALVYACRKNHLRRDWSDPAVCRFLQEHGYQPEDPDRCLQCLVCRLGNAEEFPHEIGLFLGYPLCDVVGFIRGETPCYSGYWKVYGDPAEAKLRFARYKKCKSVYRRVWEQGRSILKMTVAA